MTTVPMSIFTGTAAAATLRGTGIPKDAVANVGNALRIATQTDLATYFTEASRPLADPRCSVVSAILRY